MIHAYFIRFRLYNVNNAMHFHSLSQYLNWCAVMEENFNEEDFEIIQVISYDI